MKLKSSVVINFYDYSGPLHLDVLSLNTVWTLLAVHNSGPEVNKNDPAINSWMSDVNTELVH